MSKAQGKFDFSVHRPFNRISQQKDTRDPQSEVFTIILKGLFLYKTKSKLSVD